MVKPMKDSLSEITLLWREQMKKGYLKLAILFALTKGPMHGYQLIKYITDLTLGIITPKAGSLKEAMEKHFELVKFIRHWILKELAALNIIEEANIPPIEEYIVKLLLFSREISVKEKIEIMEKARERIKNVINVLQKVNEYLEKHIETLKLTHTTKHLV
ncbi:MAG: hypothetical protein B6U76_09675 [Desulfurococcales archaeon ex4484_217_2]|nr:MAG: hypothetical protein B6U76_09675 [Desulfurococcales archaeon ex4484_217_2]